jgi:hypothetical protein
MKTLVSRFLLLAGLSAALVPQLSALTINSPNVVGIHNGTLANANPATELVAAQFLLDMAINSTSGNFQTGANDYSGTLNGGIQTNLGAQGFDWGFAKYDGQNAGYVLFYLGGALASTIIPQFPATLWTTNPEQYAISHLTVFNAGPSVPDGGSTIAMLGAGFMLLAGLARRTLSFGSAS